MSAWQKQELLKIGAADDLHICPFKDDGITCGTPTWIWSVVLGDALYVRAYNGQKSRWYQAALKQKAGRIITSGMAIDVAFETIEGSINDRIDDAYRAKYKGSPYLASMISSRSRRATIRVVPQNPRG